MILFDADFKADYRFSLMPTEDSLPKFSVVNTLDYIQHSNVLCNDPNFLTIVRMGILNHRTTRCLSTGAGKGHYSDARIHENRTFASINGRL